MLDVIQDETIIHAGFRRREETAAQKLRRDFLKFLYQSWLIGRLAFLLVPLLFISILMLDLPLRLYDGVVGGDPVLSASNWLSRGEGMLAFSVFFLILVTRSYGVGVVTKVHGLSWALSAGLASALLVYLAPQLSTDDWPSGRFAVGFLASWFLGQLFAVNIYALMRGGKWWRAPLYGALFGFALQGAIYFPVVYWQSSVPWLNWLVMDFSIKAFLSVLFLLLYAVLRRALRPWLGRNGLNP